MIRQLTFGLLLLAAAPSLAQSSQSLAGANTPPAQPAERPTPEAAMELAEAMSPRALMLAK